MKDISNGCPFSNAAKTFDPWNPDFYGNPAPLLKQLRAEEPVFKDETSGYWIVTKFEDVLRCFRDTETFSAEVTLAPIVDLYPSTIQTLMDAGFVPGPALVDEDGDAHEKRRKVTKRAFTPQKVAALRPFIKQKVTQYVDAFVKRGEADLVAELFFELPALVMFKLLDIPDSEMDEVKKWANSYAEFTWGKPSEDRQLAMAQDMAQYWLYSKKHIARKKAQQGEDVISEFIKAQDEDPDFWNDDLITRMMLNMTFAGHETTTNSAANSFKVLLEDPLRWETLCNDTSLIPNAVEECLRFEPSVPAWRRMTKKDAELSGVTIPAGERLLIYSMSANRDEQMFADGEDVDLKRENARRNLSFGFGKHMCLGSPIGRLELTVLLEELTRRLPHMRLKEDQTFTYHPINTSFRGPNRVYVTWNPAQNPIENDRP